MCKGLVAVWFWTRNLRCRRFQEDGNCGTGVGCVHCKSGEAVKTAAIWKPDGAGLIQSESVCLSVIYYGSGQQMQWIHKKNCHKWQKSRQGKAEDINRRRRAQPIHFHPKSEFHLQVHQQKQFWNSQTVGFVMRIMTKPRNPHSFFCSQSQLQSRSLALERWISWLRSDTKSHCWIWQGKNLVSERRPRTSMRVTDPL